MNDQPKARYFHKGNLPAVDTIYSRAELDVTPWYYSIEMAPGKLTSGQTFSNVAATRVLLARVELENQSCLDIGCMEGLLSTLMKRQGARTVTAYDRPSALTNRIEDVKERFGVQFDFISGFPLSDLPARLDFKTFDVVVISGVLYHLFSPLTGLAVARGLLRNGGIAIIESAAIVDGAAAMHWNNNMRFTGESYFFPSVTCLDYFARFLRMEIIDAAYIDSHMVGGMQVARVAFACRATSSPQGDPNDIVLNGTFHTEIDLAEHLSWDRCTSSKPNVLYHAPLLRTLKNQPAPLRALRRATRQSGLSGLSYLIDDLIGTRDFDYWKRRDCNSLDLYKFCTRAKQQHWTARSTQLWLDDTR